jgi:glutathione synthase
MHYTVGVIMDPIAAIKPHKDTSFAMMLEAQRRGATVLYFELKDLYLDNGKPMGRGKRVTVIDRAEDFYAIEDEQTLCLGDVDVLLMRKDPPFDGEFLYATQILS